MAGKEAALTFVTIGDGKFYPKEKIVTGDTVALRGMTDVIKNLNHIKRCLTPTVIAQLMFFRDIDTSTGDAFLEETHNAYTDRLYYRVPTVGGIAGTPTIRFMMYAGGTGTIRFTTGAATGSQVVNASGSSAYYSLDVEYDDSSAYDTVQIETYQSGADDLYLYSLVAYIISGDDPQPSGYDVEGWDADEPLPVYYYRMIAAEIDELVKNRRGVVTSYSSDIEAVSRTYFSTIGDDEVLRQIPVKFGPYTTALRVHVNGQGAANNYVELWTDYAPGTTTQLVFDAAWHATTSWKTGTVLCAKPGQLTGGECRLWVKLHAASGTTYLNNLCVWEEPV